MTQRPGLHMGVLLCLVVSLAGCVVEETSNKQAQPEFVPACDPEAPSHLEYFTQRWETRVTQATANLLVDRGWAHVSNEPLFIAADCAQGTAKPVSVQDQVAEAQREADEQAAADRAMGRTVGIFMSFAVPAFFVLFLSTNYDGAPWYLILPGMVITTSFANSRGLYGFWVPCVVAILTVLQFALMFIVTRRAKAAREERKA